MEQGDPSSPETGGPEAAVRSFSMSRTPDLRRSVGDCPKVQNPSPNTRTTAGEEVRSRW